MGQIEWRTLIALWVHVMMQLHQIYPISLPASFQVTFPLVNKISSAIISPCITCCIQCQRHWIQSNWRHSAADTGFRIWDCWSIFRLRSDDVLWYVPHKLQAFRHLDLCEVPVCAYFSFVELMMFSWRGFPGRQLLPLLFQNLFPSNSHIWPLDVSSLCFATYFLNRLDSLPSMLLLFLNIKVGLCPGSSTLDSSQ